MFGDLIEARGLLEALRWRQWAKILECHFLVLLSEIDFLSLGQGYDRLLPMRTTAKISSAFPLLFAGVLAGVYPDYLLTQELFDGLFDFKLIGLGIDPKHVLIVFFAQ
jgi:hypothetical protein